MSLKSDVEAMIAACPAVEAAIQPLAEALSALRAAEETIYSNHKDGVLIMTMRNAGRRGVMHIGLGHLTEAIEGREPSVSLTETLLNAWAVELAAAS